jgi:carboxypeptidase Taq
MNQAEKDYQSLLKKSREIRLLTTIDQLLEWDQETYMPEGGAPFRGEQIELMSGLIHKERTSKAYGRSLAKLIDLDSGILKQEGLSDRQKAAVKEWWRDWKKDTALPAKFVKDFAKLISQSLAVWRKAKNENNFPIFAPYLDRIVTMSRQKADYLGWKEHPYDALVDLYEHDITTKQIETLFNHLQKPICRLLKQITESKQVDCSFMDGKYSPQKQIEIGNIILKDMGFDFTHGRVDISSHPFSSTMHQTDSRITTRINPTCLLSHILIILHEGGHSLYDMGLPKEDFGSPLSAPISLGMHECQSRFWETRIGQSKPFWKHYLPLLKETFPSHFESISAEKVYRAVNHVAPSFIRVDADEVTYPLHVILRFEMEKELIAGHLSIREVPEVWNAKMTQLLGITPSNDAEGCLQDIHWAMGGFGYFPTYALGTMYASHLFTGFERDHPDWEQRIGKGDLLFVREWLREAVHQHGRRYSSLELLKKVTGKQLTADAFVHYLQSKYADIYSL